MGTIKFEETRYRVTEFGVINAIIASCLAKKAQGIENQYSFNTVPKPIAEEHRAFVVSSIIMSIAFLEATINDLIENVSDDSFAHKIPLCSKLGSKKLDLITEKWSDNSRNGLGQKEIFSKYDFLLSLCNKKKFTKGIEPYQSANLVKDLRNSLVHAKPSTSTICSTNTNYLKPHEFEKKLKAKKFSLNPFAEPDYSFFPDKVLSAGSARWAFLSCLSFADRFFKEIEIKCPYESDREKLTI
jgi:hypothetical protein